MSSPARILHQLLETDRMIGALAAPRARFPAPQTAPVPAPRPAAVRPATLPPPRPITPLPVRPPPAAAPAPGSPAAAWHMELEAPLGQMPATPAPLEVLFVSVEWGPPLTGDIRTLFDRQVAAMKLGPTAAGLLRLVWPGATEPDGNALAQAKERILAAVAAHAPRVCVLFGGFSAKAATGAASLLLARGRWFELGKPETPCAACATWHPAQLGMDRDRRAQTWEDLQKVMAKLAG